MKTGHAPAYLTAFAGAMKVSAGTKTSSAGWSPATRRAMGIAAVPFTAATACFAPTYSARLCSKRFTNGPADDTQFVSRHSFTYFHSFPLSSGTESGMVVESGTAPGSNDVDITSVLLMVLD